MIPAETEKRLRELMQVFLEENSKLNMSALRTESACWTGNILDSLSLLDALPTKHGSLIDVGTGGGFPLLPLAIALPETRCTGLDAIRKKMEAIKRMNARLLLSNVELVTERSEIIAKKPAYREKFDLVTARAVAPISILLEYTVPFARVNGYVILWKSLHIDEELRESEKAQSMLHTRLERTHVYDLGGDWGKRQLLLFKKESPTPKEYPRGVGEAKKIPL